MDVMGTMARTAALLALAGALGAGCASSPPAASGQAGGTATSQAPPPTPAPAPVAAPPAPPTEAQIREDRAQAQKLALEAVDQLQNGDEPAARATLDRVQALDPNNELARKLAEQIRADPVKELGAANFRYTVQPDDTLSKLAQRFLGDRLRFYILARYNDIANPSRLQAGQLIKIPGKEPPPAPAGTARAGQRPIEPVETLTRPPTEAERLYRQGVAQKNAGNLDAALAAFSDAARREPGNSEYAKQAEAARNELVRRYDRDATQAFQRQNLELAIKSWDRVLALDPENQKAKLERARAEDLKKRLQDKFGTK